MPTESTGANVKPSKMSVLISTWQQAISIGKNAKEMKLIIKADCGNAPKKEWIKNLTIYFASYDIEQVRNYLADDVIWTLVGDEPIVGKERFVAALKEMAHNKATELTIHSIITHGKEAAINGEMVMEDGTVFGFADFYTFSSAKGTKVKSIISYVIQKNKKRVSRK